MAKGRAWATPVQPKGRRREFSVGGVDVQSHLPTEMGNCADPVHEQDAQCQDGNENGKLEGRLHADDVQPHEEDVEQQPPDRRGNVNAEHSVEDGSHIAANAHHDHRRREYVFHVFGQPRDESAPGSHRGAPEGIGAAGVRQGRRHFGDGIAYSEIHQRDDARGDGETAEAADGRPEVPAEKVAGDHRANAQRPEGSHPGVVFQGPFLEIITAGHTVSH